MLGSASAVNLGLLASPCYNRVVYIENLDVVSFRNYVHVTLDLAPGPILLRGDNAQGKTNLLEAIYFLSTTRSSFARAERQVINWVALEHDLLPYARLEGQIRRKRGKIQVDMTLMPNEGGQVHKELRVNGAKKRALDVVGQLNAVLFLPEDIDLVTGSPSARRRYLDITLCQVYPAYCQALSQYNRILTQRNALLKQLAERRGDPEQLLFWDQQLAEQGAVLIVTRRDSVTQLDRLARERYRSLSGQLETLRLYYAPSFDPDRRPLLDYQRPLTVEGLWPSQQDLLSEVDVAAAFMEDLRGAWREEIGRGMTTIGPHRDDMHFLVDGIDMTLYGSRGQQRSTALALKLGEVDLMTEVTGETPVLLLDDVMSELDAGRRARVVSAVDGVEQAIVTTTDWDNFSQEFRNRVCCLEVADGQITDWQG